MSTEGYEPTELQKAQARLYYYNIYGHWPKA